MTTMTTAHVCISGVSATTETVTVRVRAGYASDDDGPTQDVIDDVRAIVANVLPPAVEIADEIAFSAPYGDGDERWTIRVVLPGPLAVAPRGYADLAPAWGESRPYGSLPLRERERWEDLCDRDAALEIELADLDADTQAIVRGAADGINDLDAALSAQERALDEVSA